MVKFNNTGSDKGVHAPTGQKISIACPAAVSAKNVTSAEFRARGLLKAILHKALNIATDTVYQVEIINEEGVAIYTQTAIADNSLVWTLLSMDNAVPMIGTYTVKWTWTTARVIAATDMNCKLFLI